MGLKAKPDVSVLVPTRDRCDLLGRLLDAIAGQTVAEGRVEVVVADDGSGDAAAAVVERFPFARRIATGGGRGQAGASNLALKDARADVIAFTDDDTLPAPDWVERGLECFATAEADIFAGRIELSPSASPSIAELVDIGRGYLDQEAMVAEGYGATANLWVRRKVAERVGGFREIWSGQSQRFMRSTAGHDRDFCERAVLSGATLAYAPGPVVSHPPRRTVRELARKEFRLAYGAVELTRHSVGGARGRPEAWRSPRIYVPWRHRPHLRRLEEQGYAIRGLSRLKLWAAQYACLQLAQASGSMLGALRAEPATTRPADADVPQGALG
jgi:glycosyltransferase involved in cell wall biosynthesis